MPPHDLVLYCLGDKGYLTSFQTISPLLYINWFIMLASRQVLGGLARGRAIGGVAASVRRLATVSDSALDQKVSLPGLSLCYAYYTGITPNAVLFDAGDTC